ncbi:MAG: hypothetical protein KDD98_00875 [Sphingomonadaceae bacterium]|nr:hypothetical protein [Sphingomonadaceae bacterium]
MFGPLAAAVAAGNCCNLKFTDLCPTTARIGKVIVEEVFEEREAAAQLANAKQFNGVFSHYLENNLPFGGVNGSGMGSYHGYFGFKAFSHERAVYMHQ